MASSLIGALRVTLGLDTAQFETGSKRARSEAKSTAASIQKSMSGIATGLKVFASGAVAAAVVAAGKRALDYASSLGEVSQQLGVTTKDLQVYRYAATQVGVSQDEMDQGLRKLTVTIGKAVEGSKAQATTFRDLGVSVTDANGRVKTAGEVIPRLADALSKIKDPATRARIEVELFGKTGQKLDTLLSGGSAAINELSSAAAQLGVVLSDEQIQKADETADKLAAVQTVLEAKIAGIVADNAGAIFEIAKAIGAAADSAGYFFKTMEGVRRIKRDEGFWSGFLSSPSQQETAADPQSYLRMRRNNLASAQANYARVAGQPSTGRAGNQQVAQARAQLQEAIRLNKAALSEVQAMNGRRSSAAAVAGVPDGALPTVKETGGRKKAEKAEKSLAERLQDDLDSEIPYQLSDVLEKSAESIDEMAINSSTFQNAMAGVDFTVGKVADSLEAAERKSDEFIGDLSDGLADALVYGDNLGDVLVNSFKRAAAEALSNGLFDLLRGGGGGGGIGGLLSSVGGLFGGGGQTAAQLGINDYGRTGLPGFATGGSFKVGGRGGIDQNLVQFRATKGEMVNITKGNNDNGRRAVSVHVEPSPYFDVRVQEVSAPLVQQGMVGAVGMGEARRAQRARRRLG